MNHSRTAKLLTVMVALFFATYARSADPSRPLSTASESQLDRDKDRQPDRADPVTYKIVLRFILTAPSQSKLLRVWIPVPATEHGQEVHSTSFSTFPENVRPTIAAEPKFGNRFAYFEFAKPSGAQIIEHHLEIKVWELRWHVDPQNVAIVKEWPAAFDKYRLSETQAVVVDDQVRSLLKEIVPQSGNATADLQSVMTWIDHEFTYDHKRASLAGSSLNGLKQRCGHCSDYHGFCAAMGRAMGQPTRISYGINTFPKSSPSHCKLEAYLPNYGWVSFDLSETQKLEKAIKDHGTLTETEKEQFQSAARKRLFNGFRDNTWFVQTRGTDYDLAPPAAHRVPLVRTLYAEADGKPFPEPDPANADMTTFSWMTAHRFESDRPVKSPFQDVDSLRKD